MNNLIIVKTSEERLFALETKLILEILRVENYTKNIIPDTDIIGFLPIRDKTYPIIDIFKNVFRTPTKKNFFIRTKGILFPVFEVVGFVSEPSKKINTPNSNILYLFNENNILIPVFDLSKKP